MSKRVVIFSAFYEPFISGAERFVQEVGKRLQGDRFVFTIVTARLVRSQKSEVGDRNGIRIVRVGLGFWGDKYLYSLLAPIAALRIRPDIAHAVMESYAGIALWIFGLLRPRAPRILTLQSGDLDDKVAAGKIPRWLWRNIHATPHKITAISEYLANRARRLGVPDERISVIPNGVDFDKISDLRFKISDLGEQEKRIVCIARLSHEKGVDVLLRAFAQIGLPSTVYRLQLIGDGPQRAELESLAQSLGIADRVIFRGALPHEEALRELAAATVAVVPSRAEGLSIAAIEAQALGVPVLGTRVGGIPEVIEDGVTGLLVPPEYPHAMAEAIDRLIANQGLREQLRTAALARVRKFDWEVIASAVGTVYDAELEKKDQRNFTRSRKMMMEDRNAKVNRKIVFAAGIFPPAVGGPATAAKGLEEHFETQGCAVTVVHYGAGGVARTQSRFMRYARFAYALARASRGAEAILAFDAVGSGIPAAIASWITRTPFAVRIGGDYFWETASVRAPKALTFGDYWTRGPNRATLAYWLVRGVCARAGTVIFNSAMLSDVYLRHGLVPPHKATVILNPLPPLAQATDHASARQLLFAGRFIALKNIPRLLAAVRELCMPLTLVGEGPEEANIRAMVRSMELQGLVTILPPQSNEALQAHIRQSAAVVLPSYSEVSPQIAGEALAQETPVVITRAHGLPSALRPLLFEANPDSVADLVAKITAATALDAMDEWRMRLRASYRQRNMDTVAEEYLAVLMRGAGARKGWQWLVKSALYGLASIQAFWYRGSRIAIFLYHDVGYNRLYLTVSPETLRGHIHRFQRGGFAILPLQEVIRALKSDAPLPRKTVVLTFDDGTEGQYINAFRICRELRVPATFFITTGWIGGQCDFSEGKVPALSKDHLQEMAKTTGIAIEPHGVTHRHFDVASDDEAKQEMAASRVALETQMGIRGRVFAYPAGKHAARHGKILEEMGYEAAVTVKQDLVKSGKRKEIAFFALPRITVDRGLPWQGVRAGTLPWGTALLRALRRER